MTLSTNVSVSTPMNQIHTPSPTHITSPTDVGVDRGSRAPASRHSTRALSAVKVSVSGVLLRGWRLHLIVGFLGIGCWLRV